MIFFTLTPTLWRSQANLVYFISKTIGCCGAGREFRTLNRTAKSPVALGSCDDPLGRWGAGVLGSELPGPVVLYRS